MFLKTKIVGVFMNNKSNSLVIASSTENMFFASRIAKLLSIEDSVVEFKTFADSDVYRRITQSLRGKDAFAIATYQPPIPLRHYEMLVLLDAIKRNSANSITAVLPFYWGSRQDRKTKRGEPITAAMIAETLTIAGAERLVTMDLHSSQIQAVVKSFDNLTALPVFARFINENFDASQLVIVAPDAGGVQRALYIKNHVQAADFAIIYKSRPEPNVARALDITGFVDGKTAVIVDDILDTGGTLSKAVELLFKKGARQVKAFVTHALLSGKAFELVEDLDIELYTTNTVFHEDKPKQLKTFDVTPIFAEVIACIHEGRTTSNLFHPETVSNVYEKFGLGINPS